MAQEFQRILISLDGTQAFALPSEGDGLQFELTGEGIESIPRTQQWLREYLGSPLNTTHYFGAEIYEGARFHVPLLMRSMYRQAQLTGLLFLDRDLGGLLPDPGEIEEHFEDIRRLLDVETPEGHLEPRRAVEAMICHPDWLKKWSVEKLTQHIAMLRRNNVPERFLEIVERSLVRREKIAKLLELWMQVRLLEGMRGRYTLTFTTRGVFSWIIDHWEYSSGDLWRGGSEFLMKDPILLGLTDDQVSLPTTSLYDAFQRLINLLVASREI